MTRTQTGLLLTWISLASGPLPGAELKVLPPSITLHGQGAAQLLRVVEEENGFVRADRSGEARYQSSSPATVRVDASGRVQALADGEAVVTAEVAGGQVRATVKVVGAGRPATPSFRNQVLPILTRTGCSSGACHGALAGKGGLKLSLRGYDPETDHFVLTRQALGRRVDRSRPAHSLMLLKPTMAVPHGGGQKLEPLSEDYRIVADWIAGGAPGPRADDVSIERLEVFPPLSRLKPRDSFQVLVRAWYSDGTARDVTRWAKLSSSEEQVARVDENGLVTVMGHGEAAVSVWFSNLVAAARVVVPFPDPVAPEVFARAASHNAIDELVLAKLQSLNLPPSGLCSDEELIRRVYLDAAGILPTPEEVQRFLADRGADRRERLIDALLERPEFVDYWAYRWSDLFLISTRRLSQPAVWSFYRFVRRSVAENVPWDEVARSILTASGSSLDNGAASYFVLHNDVAELTEATAVTFLGMSVTCARCHNHPMERWTQDQYWGLASLFARVGLKNGDRNGEVLVQSRRSGEARHLRRGVPMPPTPLDGKPLALDSPVDRRAYFADWLTSPENPYFARAFVNRVWKALLGRGLVESDDDLRETNPPTNAALLDALAADFIAHKYDVKHLIRTILRSATYQRSSEPLGANAADDRFYSRYLVRRLPAEVILDAHSQVTGVPTPFTQLNSAGGDATMAYAGYPLGTRALQLPDTLVVSQMLDAFGRPAREQACSCERMPDASVAQALHVNNGKTLNDKLRAPTCRIEGWLKEKVDDGEAVRRVFLLALAREPRPGELERFGKLLAEASADGQTTRREALEDLFWGVLTSREFLFNH